MKYITVPSNIDYEKLFSNLKGKEIFKNEIKEATYVFLSFLYPTKKYLESTKRYNGFKPVNSSKMNQITRNRFSTVKTLLLDSKSNSTGPIIIETKHQSGVISKCYRLNDELFNNPGEKLVKLGENSSNRLLKFEQEGLNKQNEFQQPYQFLIDMYNAEITIDKDAVNYVDSLKKLLLEKVSTYEGDKAEMTNMVINRMRELKNKINSVKKKNFRPKVSQSNHRLNSVITRLNRELRYYLRINGNRLVEVDLKSSQPYVLGTILCDRFFSNDSSIEYSLINIYSQLYNELYYISNNNNSNYTNNINTSSINTSSNYTNTINTSSINTNSIYINYNNINYTNTIINNSIYNKEGFPKYFMFGGLDSAAEIMKYRNLPFNSGFYDFFNKTYLGGHYDTQKTKNDIMSLLNLDDTKKRKHINLIQVFKIYFTDINSFIESVNSFKKIKSSTAILLQRSESFLFLRIGCKEIHDKFNGVPFLTIHDSILIEEKYAESIGNILTDKLTDYTGIKPGVSIKSIENPMENLERISDEEWSELIKK